MTAPAPRSGRLAGPTVLVAGLVLLGVAQLVLPGVAARSLRERLQRSGQVREVQVHAFPAIELLWHQADRVVVRLGRYRSTSGHLGGLLDQAANVGSLDASVSELDAGLLTLRDATLTERGQVLRATARVSEADLRAALPILQSVTPVASVPGQLTLRGTASLFGVSASVDATVQVQRGGLVLAPQVPFGGLATITVFSDPRVAVQSLAATPGAGGFTVRATGRLH